MRINLVGGRGDMGKIHSKVFEELGHEVIITGRSSNPTPIEAAKISDITIISVPLSETEEIIKQVAPHAKAIVDFSSVKMKPMEWMLKYSKKDTEVAGLHPLYGETDSIKDKTIVFCKTEKTGKTCNVLVKILKQAGANIIEMTPEEHDLKVNGLSQNARTIILETFGAILNKNKIDVESFYKISPPPTRLILDLLARQSNEKNDEMYESMKKLNPKQEEINKELLECLAQVIKEQNPQNIRDLFGKELKSAQDRVKREIK